MAHEFLFRKRQAKLKIKKKNKAYNHETKSNNWNNRCNAYSDSIDRIVLSK